MNLVGIYHRKDSLSCHDNDESENLLFEIERLCWVKLIFMFSRTILGTFYSWHRILFGFRVIL